MNDTWRVVGKCIKGHKFAVDIPYCTMQHDCPVCGARVDKKGAVRGRKSDVKCNARCVDAIGFDCECECVGANHGSSHLLSFR